MLPISIVNNIGFRAILHRFKSLAFITENDKRHITALVKEEAQEFNHKNSNVSTRSDTSIVNLTEDDNAAPPAKKQRKA